MLTVLLTLICILIPAVSAMLIKICILYKSTEEILSGFRRSLEEDTNVLIDISSRDPHMRRLAAEINGQLRLLRSERRRCQQGDRELKEAVTNISHDLRTPLTAISGYLDLLEEEPLSEKQRAYFGRIRDRAEAMSALTEELFTYSVIISPQELKVRELDVVRVLEESLLSFYAVLQKRGITPTLSLPDKPVLRLLDPGALSRIFSNLISNALKYADGDFSVCMTEDCLITFSNTAASLDAVSVGQLFDRFYTVEAGRNASGLGLSIAKNLTKQMGGTIAAHYRDNRLHITLQFP